MNQPIAGTPGRYWHVLEADRIQCGPRYCKLHEGQRGLCFVRARVSSAVRAAMVCLKP
jgi:pyruvate formate lyase activating enzyme